MPLKPALWRSEPGQFDIDLTRWSAPLMLVGIAWGRAGCGTSMGTGVAAWGRCSGRPADFRAVRGRCRVRLWQWARHTLRARGTGWCPSASPCCRRHQRVLCVNCDNCLSPNCLPRTGPGAPPPGRHTIHLRGAHLRRGGQQGTTQSDASPARAGAWLLPPLGQTKGTVANQKTVVTGRLVG